MRIAPLRTTVAVVAVVAGLTGVATDANAQRVTSHPTGNASLDAYCSAAADIINEAFQQADSAEAYGYLDEGQGYWDTAIEMLLRAKAAGCTFSGARTATATDATVVLVRPTGDPRLDQRCREYATAINWAFAQGQTGYAQSMLTAARQKGCRLTVVHRAGAAPQTGAASTTMAG